MGTFGSLSTATDGKILRAAAACARFLLLERASARLGVPASELTILDGRILSRDRARRDQLTFQELTADEPLTGVIREDAAVLPAGPAKDTQPHRLEALDIVTGRARYAADLRLPNMLRGHVLHPPAPSARLVALNDRAAAALPGVVAIFREEDFVGVVAERDEQALAAVQALEPQWSASQAAPAEPFHSVLRRDEGVEAVLAASPGLRAHYYVPHISHASIGPSAAVADVREDAADLYVAVQRPFGLRDEVAQLLGLAPERVRVHPQAMSGLYGRGNMADAPMEAARLSRAARRPVLVQWTREEEFRWSPHRPVLEADLEAALDSTGALAGWRYHTRTNPHTYGGAGGPPRVMEMTSGRNAVPPYRVGKAEVLLEVVPGAVRTGAFRSLAAAPNVFAIESFMDELARASYQDPIAFRLRHTDDPRLRRVLEAVRERSGWAKRPHQEGRGIGVACAIYHGTYVAEVAEVAVKPDGQVCLERVWCAADPGRLVQPDGARNQFEGGIQQAASWTLLEELAHLDGEVITATWRDYPIATFRDAPHEIDVVFTAEQNSPSTGVGEPGSVPTAAAIANAVFDASGARVRRLPLTPANVLAARPR
jgi:CO/xanthine dehydrogenase Mo-binding subunit